MEIAIDIKDVWAYGIIPPKGQKMWRLTIYIFFSFLAIKLVKLLFPLFFHFQYNSTWMCHTKFTQYHIQHVVRSRMHCVTFWFDLALLRHISPGTVISSQSIPNQLKDIHDIRIPSFQLQLFIMLFPLYTIFTFFATELSDVSCHPCVFNP